MANPLPTVCALVGHAYTENLDDVDVRILKELEGKVNVVGLEEAIQLGAAGTAVVGVLAATHPPVTGELLDRLDPSGGNIRVVSNYGVGVDHIDLQAAGQRNIPCGNTPGVLTTATADCAFALLLASARNVVAADRFARSAAYTHYQNMVCLGSDVGSKSIGIVGMGRIGSAVARRARGFDMTIRYHNRSASPHAQELGAQLVSLEELLEKSDYVVITCPCTPETRGMFDRAAFERMRPTARLINVARGGVVDTAALLDALQSGRLAGAGLDVTDPEPLPRGHPLLALDSVVFLPHRGSGTKETRDAMMQLMVTNLLNGIAGQPLAAQCNAEFMTKKRGVDVL